jgi:uncharacterized protein with FMN-binding domain
MEGTYMSPTGQPRTSTFKRMVRKFSVSAFVISTFIAYAIHERIASPQSVTAVSVPAPTRQPQQIQASPPAAPSATADTVALAPTAAPTLPTLPTPAPATAAPPTATPAPVLGQYKDGDYTGTEVDAYYGMVQVQATIKQGKLADVQFLEYPNDRRTSIRINTIAMPDLQQEAIQAQSAQVDTITGATLTSEAFVQSLQVALNSAKVKA